MKKFKIVKLFIVLLFSLFYISTLYSEEQKPCSEGTIDKERGSLFLKQAQQSYAQGNKEEALKYYQQAIKCYPDLGTAYSELGTLYYEMNDINNAVLNWEAAVALLGSYGEKAIEIHKNLAMGYFFQKRYEEALLQWQQIISLQPENINAHLNLASSLAQLGKNQEATGEFEKVILLDPENSLAYSNLGLLYMKIGSYSKAENILQKASQLRPNDPLPHQNLGLLYKDMGDIEKALDEFAKVMELDPSQAHRAYYQTARILEEKGEETRAISAYKKAIEIKPKFAEAYLDLAWILSKDPKNYSEAIQMAMMAGSINPELRPEAAEIQARVYYKQKDFTKALPWALESVKEPMTVTQQTTDEVACQRWMLLAQIQKEIKSYPEALKSANKAKSYCKDKEYSEKVKVFMQEIQEKDSSSSNTRDTTAKEKN